jgi:hypothetical protein
MSAEELRLVLERSTGAESKVREILKNDKSGELYKVIYANFSDDTSPPGNNCLLLAIAYEKYDIAQLLIDDAKTKLPEEEFKNFINYKYKDPTNNHNRTDVYINTPLTLSAKHERYELVEQLLNNGADSNSADRLGFTPLIILSIQLGLVSKQKNQEILNTFQLLKDKRAKFDQVDHFGHTAADYLEYDLDIAEILQYRVLDGPKDLKGKILSEAKITALEKDGKCDRDNLTLASCSGGVLSRDQAVYDTLKWAGEASEKIQNYLSNDPQCRKFDTKLGRLLTQDELGPVQKVAYKEDFFKTEEGRNIKKEIIPMINEGVLNRWSKELVEFYIENPQQKGKITIAPELLKKIIKLDGNNFQINENLLKPIGHHVMDSMFYAGEDHKIYKRNLSGEQMVEYVQERCTADPNVDPIMKALIVAAETTNTPPPRRNIHRVTSSDLGATRMSR